MLLSSRSSLEVMLDSLRLRDDNSGESSPDLPPALPSRPISKARLPKRLIRSTIAVHHVVSCDTSNNNEKLDVKCSSSSSGGGGGCDFGRKKMIGAAAAATSSVSVDSIGYFIRNKLGVWCKSRNDRWELGKIESAVGEEVTVRVSNGNMITVSRGELLPANTDVLDGVDDLVELSYLNEPSVLHSLQYRYNRDIIYSKAGPVLLAFNPFKDVNIYGDDFVAVYKEKILDNPHVYAVADAAYNDMMKDGVNQSIIISGESGAGKTETAKFAMQYLALVKSQNYEMKSKLIQTSCILEAFGNAKTSRNWNSSRFGKLIDIHYSAEGMISGACIQTYLLEKSRVSQICRGERSFHVFYQMCAGAPPVLKDKLNLKMPSEYKFLNQSGCLKINGVDDAHNFIKLVDAFDTLGIHGLDQENIFELLAAILWLGNISFAIINEEELVEPVADEASRSAARLMGCKMDDLMTVLSTNRAHNMTEPLTLQQATDKRNTLANFVYESLFNWLIEEVNTSLKGNTQHTRHTISILDTYGFESLQRNSLQQLFINYADERLQQHFIRHLCKLEQEEYELEGIHWKKVEFEDNQECLDLFEKKPMGIISMLNECSNSSKATDETFTEKIKQHLSYNLCISCEEGAFRVRHYAREVQYDASGLLEKNSDKLQFDTIQLLSSCKKPLNLSGSASGVMNQVQAAGQSVGSNFMDHLSKLINQMENSKQHFIRCIKPNTKKLPGIYESDIVWEQLKCSQVMEVMQISKSRYPLRFTHQEFASRFGCLLSTNVMCMDPLSTSVAILQQHRVPTQMYQVGFTKLFFRGQVDALENLRQEVLGSTRELDNRFLGGRVLVDFHELKFGIVTLQSFIRGENARREFNVLKKQNHGIALSSLDEHMTTVVHIQSVVRGWLARKHFNHMQSWKKSGLDRSRSQRKSSRKHVELRDLLQENVHVLPQNIEELQKRVVKAESLLSERELENTALREQIRQFEIRWSEYESKMKAVEEMWQSQMASLQMNLAAAKKTLGSGISDVQIGRPVDSLSPNFYDSEDTISGIQTPSQMTPVRIGNSRRGSSVVISDTIDNLSKEFEQRKQNFDSDAKAVTNVNRGRPPSKQIEDYNNLKKKFEIWKKEYRNRLREAKTRLVKGVHAENGGVGGGGDKQTRNWWGKLSKRGKERVV
ncbi:putative myosin ATPase [Helianthus annuus]|nr:putative myosin ATPase [Helianthus annuus]